MNNASGTIQWQNSSALNGSYANISGATSTTYTVSNIATTTYYRAVLSSSACASQNTDPVAINVSPQAVSRAISGASPVCFGESKTLTYGSGSVGLMQWQSSTTSSSSNFSDILGATTLEYTATNLQQTTWFRVKNTSGVCQVAFSPAVQITVNISPPPIGDSTQLFNFSSPVYTSNLNVSGSNIKWFSTISDALINNNSLEPNFELTNGNTYYAIQFFNGCFSKTYLSVTVSVNLSLNDNEINKLKFYPNPFVNSFSLKYSKIIKNIELFNNLGQSVYKINTDATEVFINANSLPSGVYFIHIKTEDKKTLIKGIKL